MDNLKLNNFKLANDIFYINIEGDLYRYKFLNNQNIHVLSICMISFSKRWNINYVKNVTITKLNVMVDKIIIINILGAMN